MKINLILERLFIYFKVGTNAALAQRLGVSATTLSNWKSRNSIDYDLLFTKCEGVNLNWLFFGMGEMYLNNYDIINKAPPVVEEDSFKDSPDRYHEIIRAKDETIDIQRKFISLLEKELRKVKQEEPGEPRQKRKAG